MADHQPISLSTSPPPPFRPNTPGPFNDNPPSGLKQRLSTTRCRIAREQVLFNSAKFNHKAIEKRVEQLRQYDEEDLMHKQAAATANAGIGNDTYVKGDENGCSKTTSPSDEAARMEELNENSQGEVKERRE